MTVSLLKPACKIVIAQIGFLGQFKGHGISLSQCPLERARRARRIGHWTAFPFTLHVADKRRWGQGWQRLQLPAKRICVP
jgi:hypothetical protein